MEVIYNFNDSQVQDLHKLYQAEWWTENRSCDETQSCVDGSQINIGLVDGEGVLQAYARVLTDYIFKALIFDIIVNENHRGKALGEKLISLIKDHKELVKVKHFELYCLPEMISFYEKYGFSNNIGQIKLMRYANA